MGSLDGLVLCEKENNPVFAMDSFGPSSLIHVYSTVMTVNFEGMLVDMEQHWPH